MKHYIVTNNPEVKKLYDNIIFVDGSHEDVLLQVRESIYQGKRLVSHPLGASIRMFFSPYRSIVLEEQKIADSLSLSTIESSLVAYQKQMMDRTPDVANAQDYANVDLELLRSVLTEYNLIYA